MKFTKSKDKLKIKLLHANYFLKFPMIRVNFKKTVLVGTKLHKLFHIDFIHFLVLFS